MPVPFAEIDSESIGWWNLQLYFWRNAVEHFEKIAANIDQYQSDEAAFGVDASMVIVLGGTSVSQLLGQQWRDGNIRAAGERTDRVPLMHDLLKRIFAKADTNRICGVSLDCVLADFSDFVTLYDAIRHFGEPKQEEVASLNKESLCRYMTMLQNIWHVVGALRPEPVFLRESDFSHEFVLPMPSPEW